MVYTNTPTSQVLEARAIPDAPRHEMNERERRKQRNRRRMRGESKAVMERRLANDRRGPSFEAKA
ncbi:hypothetical protein A9Q79_08735 [Methylophaga sp. 42_25_T18]|nr:hypothetical protein A9Q79_08735 [Methylophaga sp. 42_25_T18]